MMKKKVAIIKLILLIVLLISLPIILYITCRDTLFNAEWLKNLPVLLANNKFTAAIILVGLQILQIIICVLPGQPIQFAASYIFGTLGGYLISVSGAIIGVIIAFFIARLLGAEAIRLIFGEEKVDEYHRKLNSGKGLLIVLLIYLVPGLPKDLVSYVAGISEMRLIPFIIVSTLGRTPPMFGSLLIGTFLQTKNYTAIVILSIICIIILIICWIKRTFLINIMDNLESLDEKREGKHGKAENK